VKHPFLPLLTIGRLWIRAVIGVSVPAPRALLSYASVEATANSGVSPGSKSRVLSRREALGATAAAAIALGAAPDVADAARKHRKHHKHRKRRRRHPPPPAPSLGTGGAPMDRGTVAALAREVGRGEPVAIVDLAAVDQNCDAILAFSRASGIAWRPAFKTLEAPDLLAYVVSKLDRPRVMIHHLRTLPQGLSRLPAGTDFLMGYPPTLGELEAYLSTPPARGERPHTLRINVDSLGLLQALDALSKRSPRPLPLEVVLEIEDFRGGIVPGQELSAALQIFRAARDRLHVGALLCYDTLAASQGAPPWRAVAAQYAQSRIREAKAQITAEAADIIDVPELIVNGPGSANFRNWAGTGTANEFSAGSAVLFANYLDATGYDTTGLHKALYLCAPVIRLPAHTIAGLPGKLPIGLQLAMIKAGGWPTGNSVTLSKMIQPPGIQESSVLGVGYGRGANSSGMVLAPTGSLRLGDYVVETCQQVMEGQDYFGALQAAREGTVRAAWPTLTRWSG
jgi:D-serine deaminase-like pyridoxal phosphate-dependent protein